MKLVTITGDHPRHLKLLDVLHRENLLNFAIIEKGANNSTFPKRN